MRYKLHLSVIMVVIVVIGAFVLIKLNPGNAADAVEAVRVSKGMGSAEVQAAYLLKQAGNFLNEKRFKETVGLCQYILWKLDPASEDAKKLLGKAQNAMKASAQAVQQTGAK